MRLALKANWRAEGWVISRTERAQKRGEVMTLPELGQLMIDLTVLEAPFFNPPQKPLYSLS